jgi:hypothetical protein
MKKTLLLLLTISLVTQAQVYIDPSALVNGTGTKASPLNNLPTFSAGTYLVKCGTTLNTSTSIRGASNIKISYYGTGAKPKIISSVPNGSKVLDLGSCKNSVIDSLEIISTNNASSCIHFITGGGNTVSNCTIHGSEWGIRNVSSTGLFRIINCEIYQTGDDGSYNESLDSIEVSGTYIHDVNQKYFVNPDQSYSGGDCLQMHIVKYINIHDNILDHSATGNKFCIISENGGLGVITTGQIINNTLIRAKGAQDAEVYLYSDQKDLIIKGNTFQYGYIGLFTSAIGSKVSFCKFIGQTWEAYRGDGASNSDSTKITNCTFVNDSEVMECYNEKVVFQKNIVYNCLKRTFTTNTNNIISTNNDYWLNKDIHNTLGTGDIQKDPLFANVATNDFSLLAASPCPLFGAIPLGTIIYPTAQINAVISPSNVTNSILNWTSSKPTIAIVDQTGKVTGLTTGTTYIKAMSTDGTNLKDSTLVTVVKPVIKMQTLSISNKIINLTLQQ